MSRAVLLGPLGPNPPLSAELASVGGDGPVARISAGWEEGERNDAEVDRHLGGGTRNLGLFGRRLDILETDQAYATALHRHRMALAEAQAIYRLRVGHAIDAVHAVRRRYAGARREVGTDLDEAINDVRALDEAHATTIEHAQAEFDETHPAETHD